MSISQKLLPGVPVVESMLFNASLDSMGLSNQERDVAVQLNEKGFAVFDFPDDDIGERVDRLKENLSSRFNFDHWRETGWSTNKGLRVQDAWKFDDDVRAIACNDAVLDLLSKIYGRRAFPFQTLNFPVGTQQHCHSDSIHFSSVPERFMCGVWLAMEDIHPDAGPLMYYPGSHKWPIIYNDMLGKRIGSERVHLAQAPYEEVWEALVEATGVQPEYFCPKKGQALIWAANLLHGGSRQKDPAHTRWSQVTHYYFEDCSYYTPAYSDPLAGNLDLRRMTDIASGRAMPNVYLDQEMETLLDGLKPAPLPEHLSTTKSLPGDFDPALYYALHPDVAESGTPADMHYLTSGISEKRRYK